jgi:hypothetical protein
MKKYLLLLSTLFFISCDESIEYETRLLQPKIEDSTAYTLDLAVEQVFSSNCATSNCHNSETKLIGLNLSTPESVLEYVDTPVPGRDGLVYIKPNSPQESYLYQRMKGERGGVMPPGNQLPDSQIEFVRKWIEAGALDN